jgi:hypothetical protein
MDANAIGEVLEHHGTGDATGNQSFTGEGIDPRATGHQSFVGLSWYSREPFHGNGRPII